MPELSLTLEHCADELFVSRFEVYEGMSELFEVSAWALCRNDDVNFDEVVGHSAEFFIDSGVKHLLEPQRRWSGICTYAEQVRFESRGVSTYYFRIVPVLWRLSQRRNHRIFQHQSVPDIVTALLGEWSVDHRWQIESADYRPLEYRVQYGETDYDFVCRLLQEAGIAYYFVEAGAGKSQLVLSDGAHDSPVRPGRPVPVVDSPQQAAETEFLTAFKVSQQVRPGRVTVRDHDFRLNQYFDLHSTVSDGPVAVLPQDQEYEQVRYQPGAFLIDDGPGGGTPVADDRGTARSAEQAQRDQTVSRRLLRERSGRRAVRYQTNLLDLAPGVVFQADKHPRTDIGQFQLLATENVLEGEPNGYWTITGCAVLADQAYRPPRTVFKPRMRGMQSALVVGPPGQEIYTDEYGRVRVQFHWDREGGYDDNSAVWLRVNQGWAGGGFGLLNIPRIGHEVLVDFLEGDPDQPVVVGRVFNASSVVPYALPDHKTKSVWKSQSSPNSDGYNEIVYEDSVGQEQLYLQAQRNLDKWVKVDEQERTIANRWYTVEKNADLVTKLKQRELIELDHHQRVVQSRFERVDVDHSSIVGSNRHHQVGALSALEAGVEVHAKAGVKVVIEAGAKLTLKGPGGCVDIHAGGIDILGKVVNINSGGAAGSGSGAAAIAAEDAEEAEILDPSTGKPLTVTPGDAPTRAAPPFVAQATVRLGPAAPVDVQPYGGRSFEGELGSPPLRPRVAPAPSPPPARQVRQKTWIEVELVDEEGRPMAGEAYEIRTPDGQVHTGRLDANGFVRIDGIDHGQCDVKFPELELEPDFHHE